ncbi:MAG TPA: DsbA family protein [Acetobacteraceae bacterium]
MIEVQPRTLTVYTDYKSPYAYLAKDPAYALEDEGLVRLEWLPLVLDIPSFLGSAEVDENRQVVQSERNPHQWRRVRYLYMDCRRQARRRGLVIRGPRKIWDSSLAAIGMLFARRQGATVFHRYHDKVFERFWKHELDIEDPAALSAVLAEAGATEGFGDYVAGPGRGELAAIQRGAEDKGVFGTPSFLLDDELFWGNEHLRDIRDLLLTKTEED